MRGLYVKIMKKFIHSIIALPILVLSCLMFLILFLSGLILEYLMDFFDKLSCWKWVENLKDRLW